MDAREQEIKEIRVSLLEREEHLTGALEEIQELQAAKAITHDRLEETLKNIERDNIEKHAELMDANREIEELGQRVYELEEALADHRAREASLNADLRSADEEFENAKAHYEDLINVLKEARRKIQEEKEDALTRLGQEREERRSDRESIKRELDTENSRLRQALSEKETQASRLQFELDAAHERINLRDRDLSQVERKLHDLEDERRKLGDEHTSNRFGLELEIDRVKRDLQRCEDELDIAKRELEKRNENLRDRDIELATMVCRQFDINDRADQLIA